MKLNKPFTDTFLQSLKPKAKEYTKHDGKESGFMIRVKPNKTKTFYFVYSFTGKYKKMSLGEYPTLSLTFAREMVKEYKGLIYRNIDPLAYRKTLQNPVEEKQLTFSEMAEKWRDKRLKQGKFKPQTINEAFRRVELHLFSKIGNQVNAGHFPKPIKFGRLARYKAEDVERFLADQEQVTEINLMGE